MSVFICQICKEPVTNFICPNRLAASINNWMPSRFTDGFIKFHNTFSKHFSTDYCDFSQTFDQCDSNNMICKGRHKMRVCAFCYLSEVYDWLSNKNKVISEQFLQMFSLGYKKARYKFRGRAIRQPVADIRVWKTDNGLCDECGEYSESLKRNKGEWVCRSCRF